MIYQFQSIQVVVHIPIVGVEPSKHLKKFQKCIFSNQPFHRHSSIQVPSLCRCPSHLGCVLCPAPGLQGQYCHCGRGGLRACGCKGINWCAWWRKSFHPGGRSFRSSPCRWSAARSDIPVSRIRMNISKPFEMEVHKTTECWKVWCK